MSISQNKRGFFGSSYECLLQVKRLILTFLLYFNQDRHSLQGPFFYYLNLWYPTQTDFFGVDLRQKADMNSFCICWNRYFFWSNFNKILKPLFTLSLFYVNRVTKFIFERIRFQYWFVGAYSFHIGGRKNSNAMVFYELRVNFLMFWPVWSNHPKRRRVFEFQT